MVYKMKMAITDPFCCRCKEDFPVAEEPTRWMMGQLRKLSKAPKKIREQFREWLNSEIHGEGYLCGNCYFDLTDDE
ncbi:hypothetical protein LCGC14_0669640 [marine sediment metagenome]|uniref:Uncharacterized protein n=1 Tax=marine sediment metagenome TaxID=412755 RepID=A0A0F9QWK4_9ZZZZ